MEPTTADHAFCCCLFHEPQYAQTELRRYDFAARYLRAGPIGSFLQHWGAALILFVDQTMLDTALALELGSVYLVTQPPAFPWAQHLWRYYAALLPPSQRPPCLHFRGLDNVDRDDMPRLHQWAAEGWDVLRAPYRRGRTYYPVRGSVSLAGQGISSMAHALTTQAPEPRSTWPDAFHPDERFLCQWWRAHMREMHSYTLIDRPGLLRRAAVELERCLRAGTRAQVHLQLTGRDGPMRTAQAPLIDSACAE